MDNKYYTLGQIYAIYEVVLSKSNIKMHPYNQFWRIPVRCIAHAEDLCHQRYVLRNYKKYEFRLAELFASLGKIPEKFPDERAKSEMIGGYHSEKRRMDNEWPIVIRDCRISTVPFSDYVPYI